MKRRSNFKNLSQFRFGCVTLLFPPPVDPPLSLASRFRSIFAAPSTSILHEGRVIVNRIINMIIIIGNYDF